MKPAALFRWETTAAGRTHSYGLGELTDEVCATHHTCARPTRFTLLILAIPPCAAHTLIPHAHTASTAYTCMETHLHLC